MEFILKKTSELSINEKKQICSLFKEVFETEKPLSNFEKEFNNTVKGYSYHGLMTENDQIVGVYSAIPIRYKYFNKEYTFALSVDTMINKKYRGNPVNLKKMADLVYAELIKDNIPFVFAPPNKAAYFLRQRILEWEDIGELDYYVLPVRAGGIYDKLKIFTPFTYLFSKLINIIPLSIEKVSTKENDEKKSIEKINDESFINWRYFDDSYKIIRHNNKFISYKIREFKKVKTLNKARIAYIMDIYPLDKNLLESAVKYIINKENQNIDIVLYTGKLNFAPINLFKVPARLNPRPYKVSGKILLEKEIDQRVFDLSNWNLNISNSDFY